MRHNCLNVDGRIERFEDSEEGRQKMMDCTFELI